MKPSHLRVQILNAIARAVVVVAAAWCLVTPFQLWSDPEWVMRMAQTTIGLSPADVVLTDKVRLVAVIASLPGLLLYMYMLGQFWRLFACFQAGRFFETRTLVHFRRFGTAVLLAAMLVPVGVAAYSVILTMDSPSGQQTLVLALSGTDMQLILVGLALLAVSSVLTEAARIAEENQGFV